MTRLVPVLIFGLWVLLSMVQVFSVVVVVVIVVVVVVIVTVVE